MYTIHYNFYFAKAEYVQLKDIQVCASEAWRHKNHVGILVGPGRGYIECDHVRERAESS